LEREPAKVGLKMNEQKTKYMIAARNDRTFHDGGQSVAIGDKHFEVVKEFVYLGSLMLPTNDVSLEIQRRIQIAKMCFFVQIALRWSHDQKTQKPTTKSFIQNQTQWKEKSRKTEIWAGGWGEE
jgi:hypothetical protein